MAEHNISGNHEDAPIDYLKRYQARAQELGLKTIKDNNNLWFHLDGIEYSGGLGQKGKIKTSKDDFQDRINRVGTFSAHSESLVFIDNQGRLIMGYPSRTNIQILESAGYKRTSTWVEFANNEEPVMEGSREYYRELVSRGRRLREIEILGETNGEEDFTKKERLIRQYKEEMEARGTSAAMIDFYIDNAGSIYNAILILEEQKEYEQSQSLEGAIIIHGLTTNLGIREGFINDKIPEKMGILNILRMGVVIPYGKRSDLTETEKQRMEATGWDKFRLSVYAYHGNNREFKERSYVGNAAYIAPVSVLNGYAISRDSSGACAINIYSAEKNKAPELPLADGVLMITNSKYLELRDEITKIAVEKGISLDNLVRDYLYIVPDETFNNAVLFWECLKNRVTPAEKTNLVFCFEKKIVTPENMGESELIDNEEEKAA